MRRHVWVYWKRIERKSSDSGGKWRGESIYCEAINVLGQLTMTADIRWVEKIKIFETSLKWLREAFKNKTKKSTRCDI